MIRRPACCRRFPRTSPARRARATTACRLTISACISRTRRTAFPSRNPPATIPARYALLARFLNFDPEVKWTLNYTVKPMTDGPVQMRNGDSNNAGSFSSDYVDGSHRWPDGTFEPVSFSELPPPRRGLPMPFRELYELRERLFQDHVTYQQGLLYFLANDPQVPKELQERVRRFGLDPNEFKETGHWPHQLYVREGRRMVSDYVVTQEDCESKRVGGGFRRPRVLSDGLALLPARGGGGKRQDDGAQRGRLRPRLSRSPIRCPTAPSFPSRTNAPTCWCPSAFPRRTSPTGPSAWSRSS